jgi:hypothetical protein
MEYALELVELFLILPGDNLLKARAFVAARSK